MNINDSSTHEARYQELRHWLSDSLRSVESKHIDLRDNYIDSILVESYRARKILDTWSLDTQNDDDQYYIIGLHEELSWIQKQLDFLKVEQKKGTPSPKLHKNQTTLIG